MWDIKKAAEVLLKAEDEQATLTRLTDTWTDLDATTAYEIQDAALSMRQARGERVIGIKLGLTSRAKQDRMGVDTPLTGWLTDRMLLPADAPVPSGELIHPRVEPEIVFVMADRLSGPDATPESVLAAVGTVRMGIEVIDSRFTDFQFRLPDVVADNASSARFALGGTELPPTALDLAAEACRLLVNGNEVHTGTGAAVQGSPARALAVACNALARRGIAIEPGWIVLTGSITDAVPVKPGDTVTAEFDHLGSTTLAVAA
jgi:2-oxo-3-hexenedioate decarboxylase